MGNAFGLKSGAKARLKVQATWLCLVILVGCVNQPSVTQSIQVTPGAQSTDTLQPAQSLEPGTSASPDPTTIQTSQAVTATPVLPAYTPLSTAQPPMDIPARYDLQATFDYYGHALSVAEAISYTNSSAEALTDMVMVVEPNRWLGGFSLKSLTLADGESITQYEMDDDQLHFSLPQALTPGEGLGLNIKYDLLLPAIPSPSDTERPQPYGYTERQTNIVDWYPYIPPYRTGQGWLVHPHTWFGEHQVFDVAEFQVTLSLSEPVPDLVIAASAPAEQGGLVYKYHLDAARTFALSASNEYLVQSISAGDVTVNSYSFPYDKYASQEALQNTADALELYSKLIMPYPHPSLNVVEADFLDGMEYDGLYFLSHGFYDLYDGTPRGYLTFIAAHETAHQWWYGIVGNDQALEPWLDEALSTYMEHIFYENIYADYRLDSDQSLVDWWWYYRVNFYDPTGAVDGTIYDFNSFYSYRNAVYLRGAKFLNDLRTLVGDETFFTFLREYAHQYKYRLATASDFFSLLQQFTHKDLNNLLDEYFQGLK